MPKAFVVSRTNPYTVDIQAGDHHLLADEPEEKGGTNLGPTPLELLLSSIGSCIAITVHMYAGRKNWPLQTVTVSLEYTKEKAEDVAEAKSVGGFVGLIQTRVNLQGDLSQEQRERLLEIAGRCPVKRALEGEVIFRNSVEIPASV